MPTATISSLSNTQWSVRNLNKLRRDIVSLAELADVGIQESSINVEFVPAPHRPMILPHQLAAVTCFFHNECCLMVWKSGEAAVGEGDGENYSSRAPHGLARELLDHRHLAADILDKNLRHEFLATGDDGLSYWIRRYVSRLDVTIPRDAGVHFHDLLHSFLRCRFTPMLPVNEKPQQKGRCVV